MNKGEKALAAEIKYLISADYAKIKKMAEEAQAARDGADYDTRKYWQADGMARALFYLLGYTDRLHKISKKIPVEPMAQECFDALLAKD